VLNERSTLTRADGVALEMLAFHITRWRDAAAKLDAAGDVTESGAVPGFKVSPEAQVLAQRTKDLVAILREFGLTPRSRLDVRTTDAAKPSGYERWRHLLEAKTS
jgi:P27 family predicted phage terminase small subunit